MKEICATQFKKNFLKLIDRVYKKQEPLLVTKRGKPWVKVLPVRASEDDFLGHLEGEFKIVGDIESPIDPPDAWEVER
jgi:prevent-host-death family protein